MPEKKTLTVLQEQRHAKPEIEGFIAKHLDTDLQKIASGFIAWLRDSKIPPKWGSTINTWSAHCKGKPICVVRIDIWQTEGHHRGYYDGRPGSPPCLAIIPRLANLETYRQSIMDEKLQDFIWDNANSCVYGDRSPSFGMAKAPGCATGKPCAPGGDVTVLGRVIKNNCCGRFWVSFWNPGEATVKKIKRLLELEKTARENMKK